MKNCSDYSPINRLKHLSNRMILGKYIKIKYKILIIIFGQQIAHPLIQYFNEYLTFFCIFHHLNVFLVLSLKYLSYLKLSNFLSLFILNFLLFYFAPDETSDS
jgi:hypothetical protein